MPLALRCVPPLPHPSKQRLSAPSMYACRHASRSYLIYFVELLCGGSVQVKRLYGADFKALHENIVNNFSDALLVKHMRLYDTACAVVEYGRAL